MTHASNNTMTITELERLLDVYGSDRTRWPVDARAGAGQLVARDTAARRLLAQAVALDRVLERAPLPSLGAEAALADRIVTAARRSPRMVAKGVADVLRPAATEPAAEAGNVVRLPARRPQRRWQVEHGIGGAAGVLAAALVLGVFIGLSSVTQQLLPALEDLTGLNLNGSYATAQIDSLDEDLL